MTAPILRATDRASATFAEGRIVESAALAHTGYSQATRQIKSARNIEYDAFTKVTSQLRAALKNPEDFQTLVAALHSNRQLWTLLAVDVADPDNALPKALKAKIFYLADFTFQQTAKVLLGQAEAGVLVDINSAIMAGLRERSSAA